MECELSQRRCISRKSCGYDVLYKRNESHMHRMKPSVYQSALWPILWTACAARWLELESNAVQLG